MFVETLENIKTNIGTLEKVESFKYLGEHIQINALDKHGIEERIQKMWKAFRATRKVYSKRCISKNAKRRHYHTAIQPNALYASETLNLNMNLKKIKGLDRKIIRKIMGGRMTPEGWRLQHNKDVYEFSEDIISKMKKRRLAFYGHLNRMNTNRLVKRVFDFVNGGKRNYTWSKETKLDLEQIGLTPQDTQDRNHYRKTIKESKPIESRETRQYNNSGAWTEERKLQQSLRMKALWAKRRGNWQLQ